MRIVTNGNGFDAAIVPDDGLRIVCCAAIISGDR